MKNALKFTTIFFALIALSALLAHLFELPGKIDLSKENYLLVQGIYRGWAWLGIFEIGAIFLSLVWAITDRKNKAVFPFVLGAVVCFVTSIVIFFLFTFPANTATMNWTRLPQDWHVLQRNWEYSHAVRAVLNLIGFNFLIAALLKHGE